MRLWITVLLAIGIGLCYASGTAPELHLLERAVCSASSPSITVLKSNFKAPLAFCKWWSRNNARVRSPIPALSIDQVSDVCSCVVRRPSVLGRKLVGSDKPHAPTKNKALDLLLDNLGRPLSFCRFWLKVSRPKSPLPAIPDALVVTSVCKLVTASATTSTKTTSTTRSSSKTTTVTTTTANPTTSKTLTSTEAASSTSSLTTAKPSTTLLSTTFPSTTLPSTISLSMTSTVSAGATLYPIQDPAVPRDAVTNLVPAKTITLEYAEKREGGLATSIIFDMLYPSVPLENSAFILDLSCTNDTLSFRVSNEAAAAAIALWPQRMVLVTRDGVNCQTTTERGAYLSSAWGTKRKRDTTYTFRTSQKRWADVAESMNIRFGTNHGGDADNFTSSSVNRYTHSSTTTSSASSTSTTSLASSTSTTSSTSSTTTSRLTSISSTYTTASPTTSIKQATRTTTTTTGQVTTTTPTSIPPTAPPTSSATSTTTIRTIRSLYNDLSPAARNLVDILQNNVAKAANGDTILQAMNPALITFPSVTMSPNDTVALAAAEAAFAAAGMDTPDKMEEAASKAMAKELTDTCPYPKTLNGRRRRSLIAREVCPARSVTPLSRRGDDDEPSGWDVAKSAACDTQLGEAVGVVSEGLGLLIDAGCAAADLYEAKDAIKCFFLGCTPTPPPPPVYVYDFDWAWKWKDVGLPDNTDVVWWNDGSTLTCVDCKYDIKDFRVKGQMRIILATGEIISSSFNVSEIASASLIYRLNAKRSVGYSWEAAAPTQVLATIQVPGIFQINPTIVISLGVYFRTSVALDVTGGAYFDWPKASAEINLRTSNVFHRSGWAPNINVVEPVFTKAGTVALIPRVRRLYTLDWKVLDNVIKGGATFTSQTSVGFNTEFLETATGKCAKEQLRVVSYASNEQYCKMPKASKWLARYGITTEVSSPLNVNAGTRPEKCVDVPLDRPTLDEINQLRASAGPYCTSYISYIAPVTPVYTLSSVYTPTTTSTTSTSTITTTPTSWTTSTVTNSVTLCSPFISTATAVGTGTQSLFVPAGLRKRDDFYRSVPTKAADLKRRYVAPPALVAAWGRNKISFACSQVATGTLTSTYASATTTLQSGTITNTHTAFTNVAAPAVTSSSTLRIASMIQTACATYTQSAYSSCPLQNQATCFQITGHGPSAIEGKTLGLSGNNLSPRFDHPAATFYIDCKGHVRSATDYRWLSGSFATSLLTFEKASQFNSTNAATCSLDTATKAVTCNFRGNTGIYAFVPTASYVPVSPQAALIPDTRQFYASWKDSSDMAPGAAYVPLTLSYTEVTCPCVDPIASALDVPQLSEFSPWEPSCPAADGALYEMTFDDTSMWQWQCGAKMDGMAMDYAQGADLSMCWRKCGYQMDCTTVYADANGCSYWSKDGYYVSNPGVATGSGVGIKLKAV
ncbi:hypothetical protein CAC42_722 [Sphaceloma murrayae]|uniref:Uncharacterized protein n=1 Tax=Sphaceloma murrayae TaxID=2082308 RepID=A0A2K1QKU7_9PEZI|nr:hypothetical protein CAC42_722 [Sphaceloma murrayae]